jgi:hypothetical protein
VRYDCIIFLSEGQTKKVFFFLFFIHESPDEGGQPS